MSDARPSFSRPETAVIALVCILLLVVSLGGGMPGDRVIPRAAATGPIQLLGFPLAALLCAAAALAAGFSGTGRVTLVSLSAMCLVTWALGSLWASRYLHSSLAAGAILLSALCAAHAVSRLRGTRGGAELISLAVCVSAAIVGALGLSEYLGAASNGDWSWRVFSTFAMPNFLAGYLVMTVPLTVGVFLATSERPVSWLAGIALGVQIVCLVLTGSRFGLACLLFSLIVFAVLAVRTGIFGGPARRKARALAGLALAAAVIGAPVAGRRLLMAGAESHSSRFRELTWRGAAKMAAAHPLFGSGIGTFDTAYGQYAEAGYTQHAHNSYLQIAAESGIPAAAFLLLTVGGVVWKGFGASIERRRPAEQNPAPQEKRKKRVPAPDLELVPGGTALGTNPGPILAGALAGICGALARNLFDSDLYVPANTLTFGVLCGVTLALSGKRDKVGPSPARRAALWLQAPAAAALVLWAVAAGAGRILALSAEQAIQAGEIQQAEEGYESAARLDPLNPEYHLRLADIYAPLDSSRAEEELAAATRVADIGKTWYRFGRRLARAGDFEEAAAKYRRARELEPNNLQNLLALAEACKSLKRFGEAEEAYRRIVALHRGPVGQVRAVPELVEWEFGAGYLGLAELALLQDSIEEAEAYLREAAGIMDAWWRRRNAAMMQARLSARPETLKTVAESYDRALNLWSSVLSRLDREPEAREAAARRIALRKEMEAARQAADGGR